MQQQPLTKLLALWKHETKSGQKILKTTSRADIHIPANAKLMIFENTHKKQSKDPDHYLMMALPESQQESTYPSDVPF